jgi:hypothetical protein
MIIVTLKIFSGRENPKWMLSNSEEEELENIIRNLGKENKSRTLDDVAKKIPSLGYRGFRLKGNLFHQGSVNRLTVFDSRFLELFLLDTARRHIEKEVFDYIKARIENFLEPIVTEKNECPRCHATHAPLFGETIWKSISIELNNNCYNYCTNLVTNTFAQPGRNSAVPFAKINGIDVEKSATGDGLIPTTNFTANLATGHYVALVIWPGVDFHWFRQDSHGCWSHKAGSTPVINTDASNNIISDPKTCDLGPYVFHTFMVVNGSAKII